VSGRAAVAGRGALIPAGTVVSGLLLPPVSSWIPLGDCPIERGPLVYLEGSHHVVRRQEAEGTLRRPAASMTADLPALAEDLSTDIRYQAADQPIDARWQNQWHDEDGL
jgi:hypothetical protein